MRLLLFLLSALFVIACGWPDPFPKPQASQAVSFKVINYNLWHGLGQGVFKRGRVGGLPHIRKTAVLKSKSKQF